MKEICPKVKCTGCTACKNACVKNAITMAPDIIGFAYPVIDANCCIDCGLCRKVCPVINKVELRYPLDCYAVAESEEKDLVTVASGGAASILSRYFINRGGVVYGCCGDDIRHVRHVRIDTILGLERIKGSKYVQSDLGNVFSQIKDDLSLGLMVFFVGTPCQVAGLKGFLRKDYDNLYTADLVCHGVPSQQMLNDNIKLYTAFDNEPIWVTFRHKETFFKKHISYGWRLGCRQPYENVPRTIVRAYKDPYMTGFLGCLTFRPNCYTCRYACVARCGDFTLADFWGLSEDAGFENGKGVSLNLINTQKGATLWKEVQSICHFMKRELVEAVCGNGQLQRPSPQPDTYNSFRELYPKIGFKKAIDKTARKIRIKRMVAAIALSLIKIIKTFV